MAFAAPLAIAASALSAGVGAIGAIHSANATAAAASYQAQVAKNQSLLAQQQAKQALAAGEASVQDQGLKTAAQIGATKAAFGASNIDVNTGSAKDVLASESALGEENTIRTRANAVNQAYGYETAATADQGQAGLYQAEASQAGTAGALGAAQSILGGASSAAGIYSQWQAAAGSFPSGAFPGGWNATSTTGVAGYNPAPQTYY